MSEYKSNKNNQLIKNVMWNKSIAARSRANNLINEITFLLTKDPILSLVIKSFLVTAIIRKVLYYYIINGINNTESNKRTGAT